MVDNSRLSLFCAFMMIIFGSCSLVGQGQEEIWVAECMLVYFSICLLIVLSHSIWKFFKKESG